MSEKSTTKPPLAYTQAGVDIDAADELVNRIKPLSSATHRTGVMDGLGGFGALFDVKAAGFKDPVLVSSTDGVGTKLKIAIDTGIFDTIGIDLVAMCVNDLVVQGAEPLFFLDYFACGSLNVEQGTNIIKGISEGCTLAGCALIGGETAEMPGMYAAGDFDLAGFTVGAVERDQIINGQTVGEGDVILGLASSGLHSNGFSLVRKLVGSQTGISYGSAPPYDSAANTLGEDLLTPTRIYVKPVLEILKTFPGAVHAMSHITGGGLEDNVPRSIPNGYCAEIDATLWMLPPVFAWLKEIGGLNHTDLARTLNTGIGFVMIVKEEEAEHIVGKLHDLGETVFEIGVIKKGPAKIELINRKQAWG